MKPIVVGVDSSPASRAAWYWASSLACLTGAQLIAVRAVERSTRDVGGESLDGTGRRRAPGVAAWVEEATRRGIDAREVLSYDDPRRALRKIGDAENASLIVVGRTARPGGPGFLRFSSVAEHLAHNLGRPLAVIPEGASESIDTVVVGVDGSSVSAAAVSWCVPLADSGQVSVLAANIDRPDVSSTVDERIEWRCGRERVITQSWAAPLVGRSKYFMEVVESDRDVAGGLLSLANRHRADALVVGARALGRFSRRRLGGSAMAILHSASTPVVPVPEVSTHADERCSDISA